MCTDTHLFRIFLFLFCVMIAGSLAQEYIIIGWSDVGMHETNSRYRTFGVHPPFNNIRAQVLDLGTGNTLPRVVTEGIRVEYVIPGNTYSTGKTDFWTYAQALFGSPLPDNIGLTGAGLSGVMSPQTDQFMVNGIPLTPYPDADLTNPDPYQLALLRVYSDAGNLLATTQPVLPVTNEIGCSNRGCHPNEQNMLMRHEDEDGFNDNNPPVQCTTCHASNRFNAGGNPDIESLSEVIHNAHVQRANECYDCHGGSQTQFYRGVMSARGLECEHCHGNIQNVARSIQNGRRPWLDEPTCASESCHGPEYAQEPGKLFKDSKGHGGIYCSACHGAPHAIYPSSIDRDNMQMVILQGQPGLLSDCGVCHIGMAPGAGPHGLTPYVEEFQTSLHKTRQGMHTGYSATNGGFEILTGVAIDTILCQNCHASTLGDGTPVNSDTYEPFCTDCHNSAQGATVAQETCLGCHERQRMEIELTTDMNYAPLFSDVHREAGMICTDCHDKIELHGDGNVYTSMHEVGAVKSSCDDDNCHPVSQLTSGNVFHDFHLDNIYCSACHVKTVLACNSCHFESLSEGGIRRSYGEIPQHDFVMLANSQKHGKVTTASFQTLTYGENTFYAIAPFHGHTVTRDGRVCLDCHDNASVLSYFETSTIEVTKWDEPNHELVTASGVIPITPEYEQSLRFDFVTYSGSVNDSPDDPFDPQKWTYLKSEADATQLLFVTPLTSSQMNELHFNFTPIEEYSDTPPEIYSLEQNYPNPFNPWTEIRFQLPSTEMVQLMIYDNLGRKIRTLIDESFTAGVHQFTWDGRDDHGVAVGSGVYVYRIEAGKFRNSKKMILIR